MASINYATREISCKIVYYGPGLSGKTTNLQIIHRKIPDKDKSEMVSLATETDRTLFFDFLPLDLGSIKGFSTKFQLYTVPGQVYYNATRKLVLRGVDGVVFVVDSQVDKLQENLESFANLQENLREYGHSIENIPLVLQYNKRDLPNVYAVEQLNALINKHKLPYHEAVAATGVGVFVTLKAIGKAVIDKFNAKYAGFQGGRSRPAAGAAPAAPQRPAAPQAPAPGGFGAAPQRPAAPQPFAGGFPPAAPPQRPANPAPGGFGAPAPSGGFPPASNPFAGNPPGMPSSAGFPGPLPNAPRPAPAPGGFGAPPAQPFGGAQGGGFGAPPAANPFGSQAPNPFAGTPPAAPGADSGSTQRVGKPGFPGAPVGGPMGGAQPAPGGFPAFPNPNSKPGFGGAQAPGPQGGGLPGNSGFNPSQGIPVSPFVDSFSKPGAGGPPAGAPPAPGGFPSAPASPFGGAPASPNPFGAPAKPLQPMPGFGAPSSPNNAPPGGIFPGGLGPQSPAPGPGFPPAQGFGSPAPQPPGGFGGGFNPPLAPMNPGGFGGAPAGGPNPFAPPVQSPKGAPPFPVLDPPAPPVPPAPPRNAGMEDNSGIVTTFEDLQKDDSFKTKKLPHPNDKKKGFFDGLFKKDK